MNSRDAAYATGPYFGGESFTFGVTAIQLKDGYAGQIRVGDRILFEDQAGWDTAEDAHNEARDFLYERLEGLFA